jgi:hypothetical protein
MFAELERHRLLRRESIPDALGDGDSALTLLRLCDEGALDGGLSVALDLTPDELIGPLCAAIGGTARGLKVLDVHDDPPKLSISLAGEERTFEVASKAELVDALNELFAHDARARAVVILGELDRMLELWCLPKKALAALRQASWFPR